MELKKILVGLDLDEAGVLPPGSREAARHAFWLAERTGAAVDFLHSTWRDDEAPHPADPPAPLDRFEESVSALCEESGGPGVRWELELVEERPWLALTRRAVAGQADFVVVGKRSHGDDDGRRLGSVSRKLVRKCPSPVWVVRPDRPLPKRGVLAATDLTPVGDLAVGWGAFVAAAADTKLWVAHAWHVPMELQLASAHLDADEARRRRQAIADAAREHVEALPGFASLGDRGHVLLACDTPSRVILEAARAKDPDLVVMGTLSRAGIAGVLVGNTAERLLDRLEPSLLTVKPSDFVSPVRAEA